MDIMFKDLFVIKEMKDAKVVAGIGGLNGKIKSCDIIEMKDPWNWINEGEVIFLNGIGLDDIEMDLTRIVIEVEKKKAAGLIIQIGPYIKDITERIRVLADQLNVPIIEIPFGTKIINITYHICRMKFINDQKNSDMNGVLKELMYLDYIDVMEEKAIYFGYSKQKTYVAITVELDKFQYFDPEDSSIMQAANEKIISYLKYYFEQNGGKILYTVEEGIIIIMIPIQNNNEYKSYLYKNLKVIMEQLYLWKNLTISVGIGGLIYHIKEFKRSSIEAKEALKMLHACKKHNDIRMYEEMGIFRILFNVKDSKELTKILEATLGPLIERDNKSDNDLVNTLEVYLMQDCNITKTSEILFLHRNTVKYRIQRIQEILFCDFNDANTCFNLRLAYKIRKFMMQ